MLDPALIKTGFFQRVHSCSLLPVCINQDPDSAKFKKQMEDLISDPTVRVYVCESQGKKTGMVVLRISDSAAEIIGIAVSKKNGVKEPEDTWSNM